MLVLKMDSGNFYSTTVAGIKMIETIKANGAENGFFQQWAGYQASVNNTSEETIKYTANLGRIPEFIMTLSNSIVITLGVFLSIREEFTLGMLMTFQGLMQSFTQPAKTIIDARTTLQEMRTDMKRIKDVMEYPLDIMCTAAENKSTDEETNYSKLSRNIEIKNITFEK